MEENSVQTNETAVATETVVVTENFESILESASLSSEVEIFLLISALSFLPFFLVAVTTFARNIIVLSFLRHALGLQQSPPNLVLISLAMFLTLFTMAPVFKKSYHNGVEPYINEKISVEEGVNRSWLPIREFLMRQTSERELKLVYSLADVPLPETSQSIDAQFLIPAFLLSELKAAFKIGFIIFLPFLIIDLVMAAILMSLGMIMVPPITISLPIKIMLFVVVDGWTLITETLVRSVIG